MFGPIICCFWPILKIILLSCEVTKLLVLGSGLNKLITKRDVCVTIVFYVASLVVTKLGGGFKYFLCSPLFGEMIQFDEHIFQVG